MNDSNIFKNRCPICKKRAATRLCDYIIHYDNSIIFFRDRPTFNKVNSPGYKHETCDLPLCKECSHEIGANVDVCPHHYKLHLQADLPIHLRKYQRRILGKIKE